MKYEPSQEIIEKYADVIVRFALGFGKGIKKGDVVCVNVPDSAKPLFLALRRAIWKAGGHIIPLYYPAEDGWIGSGIDFFTNAKQHQIDHFSHEYHKGLVDAADHFLFIAGDTDLHVLEAIDPKKIMQLQRSRKPYRDMRSSKEQRGKLTWTIALYGTPGMAKEAGLSEKEYWNQIINACYLDEKDPVAKWKAMEKQLSAYRKKFDAISPKVDRLHVEGPDADLWIRLGEKRRWESGKGANIPSFEIFTSPDWRGTEGWIRFNQPLYYNGNLIEGVELIFKGGKVVKSKASKNEKLLKQMIATPGADRIGEFSLTDKRISRITKFMAETLYDENVGGPHGNTHIALGDSYIETYTGNVKTFTKKQRAALGFNESVVHTDIISTTERTVTAHLKDGTTKVIYKDGQYTL